MNHNSISSNKYYLNPSNTENEEGGVNLIEIKNAIQRKIILIVGCTLAMTSFGLLKILTSAPKYVSSFELLSETVNIETRVTSTDDESQKTREEIASVELDEVQLKILKSPRLVSRAVESLQDKYPELSYQDIIQGLSIDIITNSNKGQNILKVVYENTDPQQVTDVVDTLTKTYINYSVEKRQSGAKRGIAFLDRQIPRVSKEAKSIDAQISELRSEYNFVNPEVSIEQTYRKISSLTQEREQINVKLQELELMSDNFGREIKAQPTRSTTALELGTPGYLMLLDQLRKIEVEIGRNSAIYSENSLEIQTLEDEKQQILALLSEARKEIDQKLKNKIRSLENRKSTIDTQITDSQLQLKQWSVIAADFNRLKQELNRANNKLNEFILRKDSLQIDAAQQDAPWLLITPAGEPANNNFSSINYLVLSSSLGLFIGIAIAVVLDKSQNIVYSASKVEEITDLPILGTIPYDPNLKQLSFVKLIAPAQDSDKLTLNKKNQLARQSKSLSEFFVPSIEAFSSFAANLGLLNFVANPEILNSNVVYKSLIITSATPGEGKSTVALNLARASASVGKRVLLVDTDMRNSTESLSKNLSLESEIGLKNILSQNSASSGLEYIRKLGEDNLYILPSGLSELEDESNSLDSSRLFASTKMHSMIEQFKYDFDLVIYDSSAVIGFADVNLLAAKVDGIVVVSGLGKIKTSTLAEALNQLRLCKAPVLGIAVNKLVSNS